MRDFPERGRNRDETGKEFKRLLALGAKEELQNIPGVGPSLEKDLTDLGYCRVSQLRGSDPEQMYKKLCILQQVIDRWLANMLTWRHAV